MYKCISSKVRLKLSYLSAYRSVLSVCSQQLNPGEIIAIYNGKSVVNHKGDQDNILMSGYLTAYVNTKTPTVKAASLYTYHTCPCFVSNKRVP